MQKNYTQLLIGIIVGLLVGLLLGRFVFNPSKKSTDTYSTQQSNSQPQRNESNQSQRQAKSNNTQQQANNGPSIVDQTVPSKAINTLNYIKTHNQAPDGYVGGRVFQNREKQVPMTDDNGNKIKYQEWDVNPKISGQNRGAERIVTGSDGRSWYTSDHYRSFTLIQ